MSILIENDVIEHLAETVSFSAIIVYIGLCRFDGEVSLYQVSKLLHISQTTVYKAYAELREEGFVRRVGLNSYRLKGGGQHVHVEQVRITTQLFHKKIADSLILTDSSSSKDSKTLTTSRHIVGKVRQLMSSGIDTVEKLEGYLVWWKREKAHKGFSWGLFCLHSMVEEYARGQKAKPRTRATVTAAGKTHDAKRQQLLRERFLVVAKKQKQGRKLSSSDQAVLVEGKKQGMKGDR